MAAKHNPIGLAFEARGLTLPEEPLDLSAALAAGGISRSYVIAMTGRCGSTWLTSALKKLPCCGKPEEFFSEEGLRHFGYNAPATDVAQHVTQIAKTRSTAGLFGFKIDSMRLQWLSRYVDIASSFPLETTAWIDMRRLNLVKQAFSYERAKRSGVWHVFSDRPQPDAAPVAGNEPSIPDDAVWRQIFNILAAELALDEIHAQVGVRPLRIVYEELLDSKQLLLHRILAAIHPDKTFSREETVVADGTKRLSSDVEEPQEIDFCIKHAREINMVYQVRGAGRVALSDLRTDLKSLL